MKNETITNVIAQFVVAADKHAEATAQGDYTTVNENYVIIAKAIDYLKQQNAVEQLIVLMEHASVGVRLWASTYLLSVKEATALKSLNTIAREGGIHGPTAATTLSEWRKGNLLL